MTTQTINVTGGGQEYTWPITVTETNGKDISGKTVQVSLGTYTAPGTWASAAVLTRPTPSSATVQLLINSSTPVGRYHVWVKVSDSPEVVPRKGHRIMVV